jgi:hypothetical protein
MLALYVYDSRFSERLCRALQSSKAVPSADWPHFERAAESAECSVIVIGWLVHLHKRECSK